ncbi:villin-3-like [Arachis stenosperma]|uniref:villin-3-like n=1 Tax=Arachis stenosperma TaxID=217475 RepID=UPI0025ACE5E6|nr:villin-3-like [Arachis stenosperma]
MEESYTTGLPTSHLAELQHHLFLSRFFANSSSLPLLGSGELFLEKGDITFRIRHAVESQDRLNGLNQGGPRQRAEALAALNSALKSSSETKSSSPKTTRRSQGSQSSSSSCSLSQVLTAKKKKQSPDSSPVSPLDGAQIEEAQGMLFELQAKVTAEKLKRRVAEDKVAAEKLKRKAVEEEVTVEKLKRKAMEDDIATEKIKS